MPHFYPLTNYLRGLLACPLLACGLRATAQDISLNTYGSQSEIYTYNGSITLTDGFHAAAGSNVRIYIKAGNPPVPSTAVALSQGNNYIATWTASAPVGDPASLASRPFTDVQLGVQYFDGLGRPLQTVLKQGSMATGSGTAADLVTPIEYDGLGRQANHYLPYAAGSGDGSCKPDALTAQPGFWSGTGSPVAGQGEGQFHGITEYENSPLDRVLKTMAPGNSWAGAGRGTENKYWVNTATDGVRIWEVSGTSPDGSSFGSYISPGTYAAGQLYKNATVDESGHQVLEFRDKDGHVVLKKVQLTAPPDDGSGSGHAGWLCTYYIYDDLGQLRGVIQPAGVSALEPLGWTMDPVILAEQCFRYEYDGRQRMTLKKVPGAGEVRMAYDARDRLVMVQDANMRTSNQWLCTGYDGLNRPVKTWTAVDGRDFPTILQEAYGSTSYPDPSAATELLTETHYDSYDNLASSTGTLTGSYLTDWDGQFSATSTSEWPYPEMPAQNSAVTTKGLVTWTRTKVLDGSGTFLTSVNIYDDKGRVIQVKSENITGGVDVATTQYAWNGRPLVTVTKTEKAGTNAQTTVLAVRTTYDELWRVARTEERISNSAVGNGAYTDWLVLSENAYDAIGQLKQRKVGRKKSAGTYTADPLETQDIEYNVRGWQLGINRSYVREPISTNTESPSIGEGWAEPASDLFDPGKPFFGYDLGYDRTDNNLINGQAYAQAQYNGNITGMVWKTNSHGRVRKYDFEYDYANRLTGAGFSQYSGSIFATGSGLPDFNVNNLTYDGNGNILSMNQWGILANGSSAPIDQLTYSYQPLSNKLAKVDDPISTSAEHLWDFQNGTNTDDDYSYDDNGNMVSDQNKKISSIAYNYLNLPNSIVVTDKGTVSYTYDASGTKWKKTTVDNTNSTTTVTTYLGGVEYQNDNIQFFANSEGRFRVNSTGNGYIADYFLKDHLGNTRLVISDDESLATPILEETHYYPFGLTMKGISSSQSNPMLANRDKTFQGQKFDDDLGVNYYSFKYRNHDPQIGRFIEIDPLASDYEYNSTYAFSENKVTNHVELEGLESVSAQLLQEAQREYQMGGYSEITGTAVLIGAGVVGLFELIKYGMDHGGTNNSMTLIPQSTNQAIINHYLEKPQPASIKPQTVVQMASKKGPKDLVGEAKVQQQKEQAATDRAAKRNQATRQGQTKEGNSNKETRGNHNSGNKSSSSKNKHENANARRAREQKAADEKNK